MAKIPNSQGHFLVPMSIFPYKICLHFWICIWKVIYIWFLFFPLSHCFSPENLVTLPIVIIVTNCSCLQVKTRSSTQCDILKNELCSEEKKVRFPRNDSWSVFGENWMFLDIGGHQTLERDWRWVALPCGQGDTCSLLDSLETKGKV